MGSRPFKGLFLQKTGAPFFFSFVTYTPQTKEQMIACGDLAEGEEFLSQVVCDFLLFISEGILGRSLTKIFLFHTTMSLLFALASADKENSRNI